MDIGMALEGMNGQKKKVKHDFNYFFRIFLREFLFHFESKMMTFN